MSAVYFDQNGNICISFFCNNSKLRRSERGHYGARTRKGAQCKAPPVWDKLHGGLSTGPKTEKGKEAIRFSNVKRKKFIVFKNRHNLRKG